MTEIAHLNGAARPRRKRSETAPRREVERVAIPALLSRAAISGYEASRRVANEPIEWVWRGIIAQRHAVEISGKTTSGKSTFAFLFAAARANPTTKAVKLLGREVTPAPPDKSVLLANEENSRQSSVAQLDRAIEILGLPARETWNRIVLLSRANVAAHWIGTADDEDPDETPEERKARVAQEVEARLADPATVWEAIVASARNGAWGLIVLDTRAKILRLGETNSEDAQADASAMITKLVEDARCPVVVVSHARKGASGDDLDDVSGSAQRAGGADVVLLASAEREKGKQQIAATKIVVAKLRDSQGDDHPEPMTFSLAKRGEKWSMSNASATSAEEKLPAHERVHRVLRDAASEMSANELRRATGLNAQSVREALSCLRRERRIKPRPTRRRGTECVVFRAVDGAGAVGFSGFGDANDV